MGILGCNEYTLCAESPTSTIRPACHFSRTPSSRSTIPCLVFVSHRSRSVILSAMGRSARRSTSASSSSSVVLPLFSDGLRSSLNTMAQYALSGCVKSSFASPWPNVTWDSAGPRLKLSSRVLTPKIALNSLVRACLSVSGMLPGSDSFA
jgi:hypothetical protein